MTSHPSGYREPQTIDWEQIHRRLAAVRNAIEVAEAPPPAILKKILKERAIALAREVQMETGPSGKTRPCCEKYSTPSRHRTAVPGSRSHRKHAHGRP